MSCKKCGREIKNYGVFLGGVRCANRCFELSKKRIDNSIKRRNEDKKSKKRKKRD